MNPTITIPVDPFDRAIMAHDALWSKEPLHELIIDTRKCPIHHVDAPGKLFSFVYVPTPSGRLLQYMTQNLRKHSKFTQAIFDAEAEGYTLQRTWIFEAGTYAGTIEVRIVPDADGGHSWKSITIRQFKPSEHVVYNETMPLLPDDGPHVHPPMHKAS